MKYKKTLIGEKKAFAAGMAVVLLANAAGLTTYFLENKRAGKEKTEYLERREYGQGDYEEELTVKSEQGKQNITVRVREKEYGPGEAKEILSWVKDKMPSLIRGKNSGLDKISYPLHLPDRSPDFPVNMSWSTDMPEVLNWEGKIGENTGKSGTKVNLTCELSLGQETERWEKEVTVYPEKITREERLQREVQKVVDTQNNVSEDKVKLPEKVDGTQVFFQKEQSRNGVLICFFGTAFGLLILPLYREKEKEKDREKKAQMQADYPDIVSRILLFLQAGLTVHSAVEKIAKDYVSSCKMYGQKQRAAYEELVETYREMEGGMPEIQAYERLGNRCDTPEYKVLSVLLVQNLKKGNQGVLALLERETTAAVEERKRTAKISGEQASTKLLGPMFIQLGLVMALIMIPAFLSFY